MRGLDVAMHISYQMLKDCYGRDQYGSERRCRTSHSAMHQSPVTRTTMRRRFLDIADQAPPRPEAHE